MLEKLTAAHKILNKKLLAVAMSITKNSYSITIFF